jgi:hypothetical protein
VIEDKKTFKLTFKDQRRIINKEITLLDLVVEKQEEIERLNNKLDKLGLLDKDIDKETKIVNMTVTLPKWLKDIGRKNKINFSKLLQESLYEVLEIGSDKE